MNYYSAEAHALCRFMVALRESAYMERFDALVPLLAEDCLLESEWLSVRESGKTAVKAWLDVALEDRWNKNIIWHYGVAEILSAPDAFALQGPFGLHILRETDDEHNSILITAAVDARGKVNRIRIEDAGPYTLQVFFHCIRLRGDTEEQKDSSFSFLLPDTYWDYLQVGMACAGLPVSTRSRLSPDKLLEGLDWWRRFCGAINYDAAFEDLAGADYSSGRCEHLENACILGKAGKQMWKNRGKALSMAEHLAGWTAGVSDRCQLLRLCEYPTNIELHRWRYL